MVALVGVLRGEEKQSLIVPAAVCPFIVDQAWLKVS